MVVGRVALLSLALVLVVPLPGSAQDAPVFLLLGEDPTGDPSTNGVPILDTWVDINSLSVATVGTDLVFHLGLEGTTTEAGSYCWMAAFEFDGTEYVGLDCYEAAGYQNDNTASGVSAPSTSRGTNVASSVVFDAAGAVITIPLANIGAQLGDTIEDVYGLTYATRALNVVDTVPDAKRTVDADESLGAYTLGGALPATNLTVAANITENLTAPSFLHEFTNATSDDYTLNLTLDWANATLSYGAEVTEGSANVTILHDGDEVARLTFTNATANATSAVGGAAGNGSVASSTGSQSNATTGSAGSHGHGNATAGNATGNATVLPGAPASQLVVNATGNWTVRIDYEGFVGRLGVAFAAYVPPANDTDLHLDSSGEVEADGEEAPGLALPLVALTLVAAVAWARRGR